jgi:hypothetical protein
VVFEANEGYERFVVVDGEKGMAYNLVFYGKIIFDTPNNFHYLALIGNEIYLVEETLLP